MVLVEGSGNIYTDTGGRGKGELGRGVVVPLAAGGLETLGGRTDGFARLCGDFLRGSREGTGGGQAGDKEGIQEPWEGGKVLKEWMLKLCPMERRGG